MSLHLNPENWEVLTKGVISEAKKVLQSLQTPPTGQYIFNLWGPDFLHCSSQVKVDPIVQGLSTQIITEVEGDTVPQEASKKVVASIPSPPRNL